MTAVHRLDIDFAICWAGNWHVGSGQGTAAVDRTLRRRACGGGGERAPFVPGSQIKGVLRHQCERLAAVLGAEVVPPHVQGTAPAEMLAAFRPIARSPLLIDRLFGTRFQGECLFVDDAVPVDAAPKPVHHSRTAIDRVTNTAKDKTLFVTEVAPGEDQSLVGRIRARHAAAALTPYDGGFPYEYSLLIAALLSLDAFGGDKTTGLGQAQVRLTDDNAIRWNGKPLAVAHALGSFGLGTDWLDFLNDARGEANS